MITFNRLFIAKTTHVETVSQERKPILRELRHIHGGDGSAEVCIVSRMAHTAQANVTGAQQVHAALEHQLNSSYWRPGPARRTVYGN